LVVLERKNQKNELRFKICFVYNRNRMKKIFENKQKPDKGRKKRESKETRKLRNVIDYLYRNQIGI